MPKKRAASQKQVKTDGSIVDWGDIHRRLERLQIMIESGWRVEPERIDAILAARAQQLAKPLTTEESAKKILEIVEFSLARENYGIASEYVREVFPLNDFTPVPCTPGFVLGIANVRGQIISIVDLRKFLGLSTSGITDLNKVIVLEGFGMSFGVVVDFIVEVRQIAEDELLPPVNISGVSGQYLLGVTAQRMAVIDTEKLLSDKKIVVDEMVSV